MPQVQAQPQPYMQALARASGSPMSHIPDGTVLGLYFHEAVPWPHGMIMVAEGRQADRALLAHELAHHVLYWSGGDWWNEQPADWVQDLVKRGACDE